MEDHLDGLTCPLTLEPFVDPVILAGDGHTYERAAVTTWLDTGRLTSPTTGEKLDAGGDVLITNHAVKKTIAELGAAPRPTAPLQLLFGSSGCQGDEVHATPPRSSRLRRASSTRSARTLGRGHREHHERRALPDRSAMKHFLPARRCEFAHANGSERSPDDKNAIDAYVEAEKRLQAGEYTSDVYTLRTILAIDMKTGVIRSKNLAASRYHYDESPLKNARPADTIILIAKTPKCVTLRTILAIDTKTGVIRSKNLAVSRYRYELTMNHP